MNLLRFPSSAVSDLPLLSNLSTGRSHTISCILAIRCPPNAPPVRAPGRRRMTPRWPPGTRLSHGWSSSGGVGGGGGGGVQGKWGREMRRSDVGTRRTAFRRPQISVAHCNGSNTTRHSGAQRSTAHSAPTSVALKARCSRMCATPRSSSSSCADPTC